MRTKTFVFSQAVLLTLGIALTGCQPRQEAQTPPPAQPGTQVETERPAGEAAEDATVTGTVKSALVASPQVGALSINVDTRNGVVTLTGTVETAAQKEEAVRIAKGVQGVREVVDQLVVQPEAPR